MFELFCPTVVRKSFTPFTWPGAWKSVNVHVAWVCEYDRLVVRSKTARATPNCTRNCVMLLFEFCGLISSPGRTNPAEFRECDVARKRRVAGLSRSIPNEREHN